MTQTAILALLGPGDRDLKSLHYALALGERMEARLVVLQWSEESAQCPPRNAERGDIPAKLITAARQAGRNISHLKEIDFPVRRLVRLVQDEAIELLVLSADEPRAEKLLLNREPPLPCRIIQVGARDTGHFGDS